MRRILPPAVSRLASPVLGALITLVSVAWSADLGRYAGLAIWNEQFYGAVLALALALVFLREPARRERGRDADQGSARDRSPPWYDVVAAVAGFAATLYLSVQYRDISENIAYMPLDGVIAGSLVILFVAEALRRTCGHTLLVIVVVFILYAIFGHLLSGGIAAREIALDRLALYLAFDTNGLLGRPLGVIATVVIAFVFFGSLLRASGGGDFFTDFAEAGLGRYRGGGAKVGIMASALFGSVSGSTVANVVSTGVITIPLMVQGGYRPHQAAAIEAVASTGGQLMPPIMGAAAFLMAEFLQVSYGEIIVAALCPALLYYAALFIQADLMAARDGIRSAPNPDRPPVAIILRAGWPFLVPFAAIILCLFEFNLSPEMSALIGSGLIVLLGLLIGYRGNRLTPGSFVAALSETGVTMLQIVMVGAAAGLIIGILNVSGFGFALTLGLVKLGSGSLFLLLLVAAGASILLGLGMPTVGVYVLLAIMISPAMSEVGIEPLAAHMFVLYFGMLSMITPPVAIAAFAAATIARADPWKTGFASMRFGWPAYVVPFLFVLSPTYLMQGAPWTIAFDIVTAVAGVWLISAGMIGYLAGPRGYPFRALLVVTGAALLAPFHGSDWGLAVSIVAGLVAIGLLAAVFFRARRLQPSQ